MATALLAGALTAWVTRDAGADDPGDLRRAASTSAVTASTTATPTAPTSSTRGAATPTSSGPTSSGPSSPTPTSSPTASGPGAGAIPASGAPVPPTRVTVPRLGATLAVAPVGVDRRGDMAIPDDPRVAGWYRFGAAPGSGTGATVIAAHVDDAERGVGPLARLEAVQRGDPVTVTAGGKEQRYRVTQVLRLDKGELDTEALFDRDGPARLHLVTCGGAFDRVTGHYEDNIVVVAAPVD